MSLTEINQTYGKKLRVRVCGFLVKDNDLLMVRHKNLGPENVLWIPPGGGVNYSESLEMSLEREFMEETGLVIQVKDFLFIHEFISPPLHAIEIFFKVELVEGSIKIGSDPDLAVSHQIIDEVRFLSFSKIISKGLKKIHQIFRYCNSVEELLSLKGHFKSESQ